MKDREASHLVGEIYRSTLPTWEDVQRDGLKGHTDTHIELVRDGSSVLPVIFLQRPQRFSATIDESTPCTVVVDIVTVLNLTEIFGCIVPVLWDGEEARWETIHLSLFPISEHGEVDPASRTQAALSREILRSFGEKSPACGLVVFDGNGQVILARRVPIGREQRERISEIDEVVSFLSDYNLVHDGLRLRAAEDAYRAIFCYAIEFPIPSIVPSTRSLLVSGAMIRALRVDNGRLIDRKSPASLKETEPRHDLFISYCHLDTDAAHHIASWIRQVWPDTRLSISDPDDVQRAEEDANYFFKDARHSKALLYIATPNSIGRPVVSQEIGNNAHKPIVTVVLGDHTAERLAEYLATNPFLNLDREGTVVLDRVESWRRCGQLLAQAMEMNPTAWITPPQVTVPPEDIEGRKAAQQAYGIDDWERIKSRRNEQTEEEAGHIVDDFLNLLLKQDRILAPALQTPSPRSRLILLLEILGEPQLWLSITDLVPALVDDELVSLLKKKLALRRLNEEEAAALQLEQILSAVRAQIQLWDHRLNKNF
ncbi:MAG: hypothetical protein JMN27_03660 [gamma proteobacterium endosymbiont of Lamellibrachia anaximandri]|nr:hypothetical protein [gamma proteobacterium endosymbiont of Lamellibrachia anaximandri]MBL3532909.1 hypothetical protein [gamma proteobacterium endosymbiont of Lamellibrachia anaximandri]